MWLALLCVPIFFLGVFIFKSLWGGPAIILLLVGLVVISEAFKVDWKKRRAMKRNKPAAQARRRKKYGPNAI